VQRTQPVALIDLAPTFVQSAGAVAGLVVDGTSLTPVAQSSTYGLGRVLVIEAGPRLIDNPWFYRGLRSDHYLYVEYEETGEVEYYDLVKDPYQLLNLAYQPTSRNQRLIAEAAARLDVLRDCAGAACRQ